MTLSQPKRRHDSTTGTWHIELLESLVRRSSNAAAPHPPGAVESSKTEAASHEIAMGSRREPRETYLVRQVVAPYVDHRIPASELFQEVECIDISKSGIAFLADHRPETEMIVITTGDPSSPIYRSARIVHVREVDVDGAIRFRVGCEFIGRLSRHLFS
jgi:hypothetical protein